MHFDSFSEKSAAKTSAEAIDRDFSLEWNGIFFNKLLKYQNHQTVITRISAANSIFET
jgi:hypothetical protein